MDFVPLFHITLYSHFFKITRIQTQGRQLLDGFLLRYIHQPFKPPSKQSWFSNKEPKKTIYGLTTRDLKEYRFQMGQFVPLKDYLRSAGWDERHYVIDEQQAVKPKPIKSAMIPDFVLKDYQEQGVSFLNTPIENDPNSRLITLATGLGKGSLVMWANCQHGSRVAYVILPSYIDKTGREILEKTTSRKKDIMIVQGSDSLRGLIDLAKTNQYKCDYLLISNRTWVNYLDEYLEDPLTCIDQYGCRPEELFPMLGIGTVVFDEIHQQLHAVYKTLCSIHTERVIGLSATFLSDDQFVEQIQKTMFPREIRFNNIAMKKYIRAYGIAYSIDYNHERYIKTTVPRSTFYSQSAFENSIMKRPELMKNYLLILKEVFENGFMDQYKSGYKCIVFVRTIEMATRMVDYLKSLHTTMDIRRYVEEDPYKNVIEAEVIVSTQQSAGTALDIPGLVTTISMDNIGSSVANLQQLGRLREPKEGIARYYSVYCDRINKHVNYHKSKRALFQDRVVSFKEYKSNIVL